MDQFPLDLSRPPAFGRSDFLVSDSNTAAVGWIGRWPEWPTSELVMFGPSKCGKTHLAHIWRRRAEAAFISGPELTEASLLAVLDAGTIRVAVDDAERACERALLHLYNCCHESGGSLLITARRPPGSWGIGLADLRSRLCALAVVGIDMPDDGLLGAVLVKHFADRQLRVRPALVAYLVSRIERSFAAAADIVATLDATALAEHRPIGISLARRILDARPGQSLPPGSDFGVT